MIGYLRCPVATLRLYYNGYDYVIAHTPEDAAAFIAIHFGEGSRETRRADVLPWEQIAPDVPVQLAVNDQCEVVPIDAPNPLVAERTAREWCRRFGRGYLASTKE